MHLIHTWMMSIKAHSFNKSSLIGGTRRWFHPFGQTLTTKTSMRLQFFANRLFPERSPKRQHPSTPSFSQKITGNLLNTEGSQQEMVTRKEHHICGSQSKNGWRSKESSHHKRWLTIQWQRLSQTRFTEEERRHNHSLRMRSRNQYRWNWWMSWTPVLEIWYFRKT